MRLKLPNNSNIISLSLGIICALGNDPWALWYFSIFSLIIWFWLIIKNKIPKDIFKETFRFGFGYFFISLIWIVEPFFVEPWIHGWIAPIALIALPSFLALIWALFAFFGHYFLSSVGIVMGLSLAEYCRLFLLTRFTRATNSNVFLVNKTEKRLSIIGP